MHELSIATNIVEIAENYVREANGKEVKEIEIDIGTLSGVILDALNFAMDISFRETVLSGANIKINEIQAKAKCEKCGHIFEADDFFTPCPKCQSFQSEVIEGKELKVKTLLID